MFVPTTYRKTISKVLVKCRQNVANKIFISHYFLYTCNKLTALTAKCSTESSHKSKGGRGKLFLCGGIYRIYIQYCCSGCWSIWKCWLCGMSSKYGPSLIAQSSTNQLALSPGSPARPSNSGGDVRFVLHGSSLA